MFSDLRKKVNSFILHDMRFSKIFLYTLKAQLILAVGITCMVVFVTQYVRKSSQERSIHYSAMSNISAIARSADNELCALGARAHMLFLDKECSQLLAQGKQDDGLLPLRVAQLLHELDRDSPVIDGVFLYLFGDERVISSKQTDPEEEKAMMHELLSAYESSAGSNGKDVSLFVYGQDLYLISLFPEGKPLALLFIRINSDMLWNRCYAGELVGTLCPYVMQVPAFPNQTEYPSGDIELKKTRIANELRNERFFRIKGQSTYLLSTHSDSSGIDYVLILPDEQHVPENFALFVSLFVFGTLLLLYFTSAYLSKNVYKPVHNLLNSLRTRTGSKSDEILIEARDELDLIRRLNDSHENAEAEMTGLLKSVGASVGEKLFQSILEGQSTDESEYDRILANAGLPFRKEGLYRVFAVAWEYADSNDREALEREIYHATIEKQLRGYWGKELCCILPLTENTLLLTCSQSPDDPLTPEAFSAEIRQLAEKLELSFFVGTSDVCSRMLRLDRARAESLEDLRRKRYYREAGADDSEQLRREINRELDRVERHPDKDDDLIPELFDRLAASKDASWACKLLTDVVLERMIRLNVPDAQQFAAERNEHTGNNLSPTANDLAHMRILCEEAQREIRAMVLRNQFQYVQDAKRFLQTHYGDSTISLERVSEYCGISSSYLSKLFSVYESSGFLNYLTQYRLDRACSLLLSTEETINDIGFMTGFNSPQSFIRVFKRYLNETPGQYRTRCRKEKREDI